jgi:hypothetical protein
MVASSAKISRPRSADALTRRASRMNASTASARAEGESGALPRSSLTAVHVASLTVYIRSGAAPE